ncbi:kinase-like protein [Rickenella mellea]|uniref:Kinase-like protein n=1 Tax=Rickenella mellea TaxID=50990 RepID=A0A4Y7PWU7_9AGAM|nr:kinase-like protein [Rickenella mellea]
MCCPPASEAPSVDELEREHNGYMNRISEDDSKQSNAFTAGINLEALKEIAGLATARSYHRIQKIYQGGFNQIFALSSDDDNAVDVIARVNMPFGGGFEPPLIERQDRVLSEVATLKWLKKNTSIPVPQVFAFDANPENDVGGAYMIQERIMGRPLTEVWSKSCLVSRMEIIKQLAHFQAQLFNTSFSQIGSLLNVEIYRGPWNTPREEMKDLMEEQLAEIRTAPEKILLARQNDGHDTEDFRIDDFEKLYATILHVVQKVELLDQFVGSYSILHPDFNSNNVMVGYDNPSRIVGIIDWEGTRVQPKWNDCGVDFMWDPGNAPCCVLSETTITWDDVIDEWKGIVFKMGPHDLYSDVWRCLARLDNIVCASYVDWANIQKVIDDVTEWRSNWPQLDDVAFGGLDDVLQSFKNVPATSDKILVTVPNFHVERQADADQ